MIPNKYDYIHAWTYMYICKNLDVNIQISTHTLHYIALHSSRWKTSPTSIRGDVTNLPMHSKQLKTVALRFVLLIGLFACGTWHHGQLLCTTLYHSGKHIDCPKLLRNSNGILLWAYLARNGEQKLPWRPIIVAHTHSFWMGQAGWWSRCRGGFGC